MTINTEGIPLPPAEQIIKDFGLEAKIAIRGMRQIGGQDLTLGWAVRGKDEACPAPAEAHDDPDRESRWLLEALDGADTLAQHPDYVRFVATED